MGSPPAKPGDYLADLTIEDLQLGYLGFTVVKPLPRTIVGRTCITTYPSDNRRHFPITRTYSANIFGIELKVENSLAFQEQDTVVAACATSALWSVFHGTGMLFQHAIHSPSAITKIATEQITDGDRSRAFPSHGLDAIEMARAIKDVGLEPHSVRATNEYLLKGTAYAYLRAHIPMIFGFELWDVTEQPNGFMGKHAVALTGFSLPDTPPVPYGPSQFCLRASRIDKFYVHDDQVGPFARMSFDGERVVKEPGIECASIGTSWRGSDGVIGHARAVPDILLVPLYHKIRIPFGCIHDQVMEFDPVAKFVLEQLAAPPHEWDIYLTTVNELKKEVRSAKGLSAWQKASFLTSGLPKYIWRATATCGGTAYLDLLFDATDIEQGTYVIGALAYSGDFSGALNAACAMSVIESTFQQSKAWPIIAWVRTHAP